MEAEGFSETTFGDLIQAGILEIGDGYRTKLSELGGSGAIFLRAGHVTDQGIGFVGVDRFKDEHVPAVRSKLSRPGDVVVTTEGNSIGRTAYVTAEMPEFVYSPHLSFWRSLKPARLVPGFLRYWANGHEFTGQLDGMKASTDMAPYLSLSDQRRLKVTIPDESAQRRIAAILEALDHGIELNQRMNVTLEAIVKAIFKSWFVDFDPVAAKVAGRQPVGMDAETAALFPAAFMNSSVGPIPDGWEVSTIGFIGENRREIVQPEAIAPDTWYIGLEDMSRGSIVLDEGAVAAGLKSAKVSFRWGDVLFGKLRPYFHKVGFALCSGVCSTDIVVVTPGDDAWRSLLLGHLSSKDFVDYADGASGGTRMPRVSWEDMARYTVVLPGRALADALNRVTIVAFEQIAANVEQNRTLAELRDMLLPKLLSGEMRLKQAEKEAEQAGA